MKKYREKGLADGDAGGGGGSGSAAATSRSPSLFRPVTRIGGRRLQRAINRKAARRFHIPICAYGSCIIN